MNIKSHTEETENMNLVMFPSSKNFPVDLESHSVGKDPLTELLSEYSHLKDEDIPSYLDDRFEMDLENEEEVLESLDAFDSLEAFMNRHQKREIVHPDDKLIALINERIEAINEAKARIKFYLEEIEMFLPAKRR